MAIDDSVLAEILEEIPTKIISIGVEPFKDDKGRIIAPRLAEVIRNAGHVVTGLDRRLWHYDRGVYRPDGDQFVAAQVRVLLEDEFRRRHLDEVLVYLRSFPPTVTNEVSRRYLNLANGLLDLQTRELHPHTPEFISTVQIPVSWKPDTECPTVDYYLRSALPSDALEFIVEVIGYALYPGNPFRKAVMLLGPTGTGKSVLLLVIEALLGSMNCSHVPLQSLGENRFAAASLFGKSANICGDLDARAIRRTDLFKQITGGDPIFAEHKGKEPFSFTSFALPIFSANEAPISSDQTDAWFGRWLIIPMDHAFEGTDENDPRIRDKVTAKSELEGLLVQAVDALRTLMTRGQFDPPPSVTAAGERYRDVLDSARGFVSEACILGPEIWTPKAQLYTAYRSWCKDTGRLAVSASKFMEHLRQSFPMRITESVRRGNRGWQGIGLVKEEQ